MIAKYLLDKLPGTDVVLLALFPRGFGGFQQPSLFTGGTSECCRQHLAEAVAVRWGQNAPRCSAPAARPMPLPVHQQQKRFTYALQIKRMRCSSAHVVAS